MKKSAKNRLENLYSLVGNEEDARICSDISEEACRNVPVNFFLIILSNTLTRFGDALSNPKTTLSWLMSYVSAPVALISFLVPIRESGSMLPQIFIASYIRRRELRKWIWVIGAVLQCAAIAGMGIVTLFLEGAVAGWMIILLLVFFSLARGLSSVASKDVIGKTIPKTRRGRLNGYSTSISGALALLSGLYMISRSNQEQGIEFYAYLIFFASLLWIAGALVYANIREEPGETSGGGNAFREAIMRLEILKTDKPFRNFVISRALLLCSALTAPFYVVLAQQYLGKDVRILGLFIIANGIAASISAMVWGRMADRSSKGVMVKAAIITSLLGVMMFAVITWMPALREMKWVYPVAFFFLGVAHSGVRLGRKTYIVDLGGGNKRTDYVAVSNTVIGLVLLLTGGISAAASAISPEGIILILSLFGVAGAFTSSKLPEVEV
ncbi:MAG: MFS transporter [Bacteroidales bacterium]